MQSPLDGSIIVTQLDFNRLARLIDVHESEAQPLEAELDRAIVVAPGKVPENVVTMNSDVVYEEADTGRLRCVRIVYPEQADVTRGWISVLAPIGSALLGLRVGQSILWRLPTGVRRIRVVELAYQPEAAGDMHL
jgi:regulator of nucleoside diphosphate kinase